MEEITIDNLVNAKKNIEFKQLFMANDERFNKYEMMHFDDVNHVLYFLDKESDNEFPHLICKPEHGALLLGFEVNNKIFYQPLGDRYESKRVLFEKFVEFSLGTF